MALLTTAPAPPIHNIHLIRGDAYKFLVTNSSVLLFLHTPKLTERFIHSNHRSSCATTMALILLSRRQSNARICGCCCRRRLINTTNTITTAYTDQGVIFTFCTNAMVFAFACIFRLPCTIYCRTTGITDSALSLEWKKNEDMEIFHAIVYVFALVFTNSLNKSESKVRIICRWQVSNGNWSNKLIFAAGFIGICKIGIWFDHYHCESGKFDEFRWRKCWDGKIGDKLTP